MQETKTKLQIEKEKLQKEEEYVKSDYYLEKVARDELHLAKPGETVLLIPDNQKILLPEEEKSQDQEEKPNWRKWWEVLSGRI